MPRSRPLPSPLASLAALLLVAGAGGCRGDRTVPSADSVPVAASGPGASGAPDATLSPGMGGTVAPALDDTVPATGGASPGGAAAAPGATVSGGPAASAGRPGDPGPAGAPVADSAPVAGTTPAATPSGAPGAATTLPPGPSAAMTPGAASAAPPVPANAGHAAPSGLPARAVVAFSTGEKMTFDVRFGSIDVGDGTMEVRGMETVRGREAYHTVFRVKGGTLFFKVDDRYESWLDVQTLSSLRHVQQIDEGTYERERVYEIYPDRGVFRENQKPEQPTVAQPLDDGSFFYFVRTIPLEVGKTYTFERYFRPDRNPVTIRVVRKERIRVPAGAFDAIVIQPMIRTKGIFGEGGRAEIWLADDSTRAMLQMKSQLKFGSLNLYLKSYRAGKKP